MKRGPFAEPERSVLKVIDLCPQDVGRHHVRSKLDSCELRSEDESQGLCQKRLAESRHPFQQHMPPGQGGSTRRNVTASFWPMITLEISDEI